MRIQIELTEKEVRELVLAHIREQFAAEEITPEDVKIEVKSTQNYRAEWEPAAFRARVDKAL